MDLMWNSLPCSLNSYIQKQMLQQVLQMLHSHPRDPSTIVTCTSLFPVSRLLEKGAGIAECLMVETMMDCALSAEMTRQSKSKKLSLNLFVSWRFLVAWRRAVMVEWWRQKNYRSGLWKKGKKCEINNFYKRFNSDLFHFKKPQIIFFIHSSVNGHLGCFQSWLL